MAEDVEYMKYSWSGHPEFVVHKKKEEAIVAEDSSHWLAIISATTPASPCIFLTDAIVEHHVVHLVTCLFLATY